MANVDWLTLDASCVTQLFPLLYDGILRDIYNQKASMAWRKPNSGGASSYQGAWLRMNG